jgi:ribonuclease HII
MLAISYQNKLLEAGCDEAGRGCMAGPVFAAAVILPPDFNNELLNDSKKLSEKSRNELRPIIEKEAIAWAVASLSPAEIDEINILNASIKSMQLALDKLKPKATFIAVDGNRFKAYKNVPHQCIVKGDGKFANIAAASILAKTHRDEYMLSLHQAFPIYDWKNNKGYPSPKHIEAMRKWGNSPHHRTSFHLKAKQLQLDLT